MLTIEDSTLTLKKCASGPQGIDFAFKLAAPELGVDEDGEPVTQCTVEWLKEGAVSSIQQARIRWSRPSTRWM